MMILRRYSDGHWWLRLGRFTVGTQYGPAYVSLGEREGWTHVWRWRKWSATRDAKPIR